MTRSGYYSKWMPSRTTDLFSRVPRDVSIRLLAEFDRLCSMPAESEEQRRVSCLAWLEREYPARIEQQVWRKRDVREYHDVMGKSQPRLRD